jgi:hypothetical protein
MVLDDTTRFDQIKTVGFKSFIYFAFQPIHTERYLLFHHAGITYVLHHQLETHPDLIESQYDILPALQYLLSALGF